MQGENKLTLTSAEIANLWNMYMHDTIIVCFKKYTIAKAEDEEIRTVLQEALNLSERRSKDIASIFSSHNLPVPVSFSDKDVLSGNTPGIVLQTRGYFHSLCHKF